MRVCSSSALYATLSLLVMALYVTIASVVYVAFSNVSNRAYLVWAERTQMLGRLADMVLDLPPVVPHGAWAMHVSNAIPQAAVVACVLACALARDLVTLNMLCVAQALAYLLNAVSENVTIVPSSYGYARCLDYLGVRGSGDLAAGLSLSNFQLNGSCAAMMWSGHTTTTMLGVYFACRACGLDRGACRHDTGPTWCTLLALLAATFETALLLADAAHYTNDCYISILLTSVVVTHPSFARLARSVNPFIGRMRDASIAEYHIVCSSCA